MSEQGAQGGARAVAAGRSKEASSSAGGAACSRAGQGRLGAASSRA